MKKIKGLVSTLICTYNAEKFFKGTIESVLDQTYKDQEILIWDDGSIDNTIDIIKEYQKKDSRIKFWTSKDLGKKLGPYGGLNFLIDKSRGKFIAIQDHDDIWHPKKLETQVNFMNRNIKYIGCGTGILMFFGKSFKGYVRDVQSKDTEVVMHPSLLFRNKGFKYDEKNMFLGDVYFMKKVLCEESKLKIIPEILVMHYGKEDYTNYSDIWFDFSIKNCKRYLEVNNINLYNMKIRTLLYYLYMSFKKILPYKIQAFSNRKIYKDYEDLINNNNNNKLIELRNKYNVGINAKTIFTNFLPLFLSISKTLEKNGYNIYFINPNLIQKHQLKKYGIKYISGKPEELVKKYNIKKLLHWNGTYNNIKIDGMQNYYFENGYFGNDLQILHNGVNAKSEICNIEYEEFLKIKNKRNIIINKKNIILIKKIRFNIFNYYLLGFLSQGILPSFKNFSKIIKKKIENIKKEKILDKEENIILQKGKYVLIGFQVHDDSQILYNSLIIKKIEDILNYYYNDIKKLLSNYKIIVKEHPIDIGRKDYSNLIKKYPDIIWVKKGDINNYLEKSEYIITVNSSIGLQALSKYKKVLLLGNSFYSNNPWVKQIKNKDDFKNKLLELKNMDLKKDKEKIDKYINVFKNEIFVSSGGWKTFTKQTIKDICERILNY